MSYFYHFVEVILIFSVSEFLKKLLFIEKYQCINYEILDSDKMEAENEFVGSTW